MLEPSGELDLLLEALGAKARGDLVVQDLQCDGAVVAEVMGEIDNGEATASEHPLETVSVGKRRF